VFKNKKAVGGFLCFPPTAHLFPMEVTLPFHHTQAVWAGLCAAIVIIKSAAQLSSPARGVQEITSPSMVAKIDRKGSRCQGKILQLQDSGRHWSAVPQRLRYGPFQWRQIG
jgi:hypothetical protein